MKNLKEKLSGTLGVAGTVIWFAISSLLTFAPIWTLDLPLWASFIAVAVYFCLPVIGDCMMFGLWIWSFGVSFTLPRDMFTAFYYVAAVIYLTVYLPPFITNTANLIAPKPRHYFWENAPMKYYYFLIYFACGLSILTLIASFINSYAELAWLSVVFYGLEIILNAYTWYLLAKKMWRGPVLLCLTNLIAALFSALSVSCLIASGAAPGENLSNALASTIVCVLLWIYFCKRRPLFSPWEQDVYELEPEGPPQAQSNQEDTQNGYELVLPLEVSEEVQRPPNKEPKKLPASVIALSVVSVLLIVALSASIWYSHEQAIKCEALMEETASLEEQLSRLKKQADALDETNHNIASKMNDLEDERDNLMDMWKKAYADLFFYYNRIGFVVDGSSHFHSFDCEIFEEADTYWAHNIEFCKSIGYTECPYCFDGPDWKEVP